MHYAALGVAVVNWNHNLLHYKVVLKEWESARKRTHEIMTESRSNNEQDAICTDSS
jgi:hypothetical protein